MATEPPHRRSDWPFFVALGVLGGTYVVLLLAMLIADIAFTSPDHILAALRSPEIQYSIRLSLLSSLITAQIALWIAVPIGYLMSRCEFPGKAWLDALLDLPVVLPPLVIGISLLILFQTPIGRSIEGVVPLTAAVPGVILAQSLVATALAVRTMRVVFDRMPKRAEQVAWTLGCSRAQAFFRVVLPEAYPGMISAGTLAWAQGARRFRPGARLRRFDADEDGNAADVGVSRTQRRQPARGRRRVAVDGRGGGRRARRRPPVRAGGAGMIAVRSLTVRAGLFAERRVIRSSRRRLRRAHGPHRRGQDDAARSDLRFAAGRGGSIHVADRCVTQAPAAERGIGYVPQDLALFPSLTVRDHLGFALSIRRQPNGAVSERVTELASCSASRSCSTASRAA